MTRRLAQALPDGSTSGGLLRRLGHCELADRADAAGAALDDLLSAAAHEAALARHPYIDADHVYVAALLLVGDGIAHRAARQDLSRALVAQSRWWRMRGPGSAPARQDSTRGNAALGTWVGDMVLGAITGLVRAARGDVHLSWLQFLTAGVWGRPSGDPTRCCRVLT
jgi:hypothetical protein